MHGIRDEQFELPYYEKFRRFWRYQSPKLVKSLNRGILRCGIHKLKQVIYNETNNATSILHCLLPVIYKNTSGQNIPWQCLYCISIFIFFSIFPNSADLWSICNFSHIQLSTWCLHWRQSSFIISDASTSLLLLPLLLSAAPSLPPAGCTCPILAQYKACLPSAQLLLSQPGHRTTI